MLDEQPDVEQLDLPPQRSVERLHVELGPKTFDALPHAKVVEADPLLRRALPFSPGGVLEPLLRRDARQAKEAVVTIEALDQDADDRPGERGIHDPGHADRRRAHAVAPASNCASSVDPLSASVSLSGDTACVTRSKYPAPTSRWWRVAV
jgi:hypothetical protein